VGIGASIVLIAIGAILEYALPHRIGGVSLGSIGQILMLVGVLGLVVAVLVAKPWARSTAAPPVERRPVEPPVERRPVEPEREVVVERRPVEEAPRSNRPW
jgi:hypothetical protein